jgi:hypothetical protein
MSLLLFYSKREPKPGSEPKMESRQGVPDHLAEHGSQKEFPAKPGLDGDGIFAALRIMLRKAPRAELLHAKQPGSYRAVQRANVFRGRRRGLRTA